MTRVFVYGTLKRGGSNHPFLAGQRFLGRGRTPPGFTLYALGGYPGMVRADDDRAGVEGEVWEVDDACLARLDELEGLAEGLYERVGLDLVPSEAGRAQAYLYLRSVDGRRRLGSRWPESGE
jgi:gamma-glutamylcyclotransferase (GGCT)/AIG2-like uncharacterized protein YtfP